MKQSHAKKPEAKTQESQKAAPKAAEDADGTTSMDEILREREAENNSREEAGNDEAEDA